MNRFAIFIFLLIFISCSKKPQETLIKGNIPNLPDGFIYLLSIEGDKLDSTMTKKGKFQLAHTWVEKEPRYIRINHIDEKGILRFFSFRTNAKYRGANWGTEAFLSDPLIEINGNLKYDTLVGIQLPPDRKPVTGPPLKAGKQTEAFYSIDGDMFEKIDDKTIVTVREKLRKYPFSYHLLFKINENKNSFSTQQVDEFLKLFKGEITESETYKNLLVYNQKRFSKEKLVLPMLMNSNGVKQQILDKNYKKHLIVFWASWCGPCRKEIPFLKDFYNKKNSELEFISISIDDNKNDWAKVLNLERMPWKQLVVSNEQEKEAMQLQFKLNSAIPYSVLVDSNFKIISASTGLSNKEELEKLINN